MQRVFEIIFRSFSPEACQGICETFCRAADGSSVGYFKCYNYFVNENLEIRKQPNSSDIIGSWFGGTFGEYRNEKPQGQKIPRG
jgi:hypothetical protein